MATPATVLEGLKAVAYFVAWPGLLAVSVLVLVRAARFHKQVNRQPVGRLVLLMVVGSVMTWAAFAGFATYDLSQRDQAATIVLPLFFLWAGSMVLITWIMHRWGAEAVKLNLYHSELSQMDQMKAQLINTVAHEINTPLTPIRFRISTMKARGFGQVTGRQVEALESIEKSLDRVDGIVGKMVMSVQLQTAKLQLYTKSVSLEKLLGDQVVRIAQAAHDKGVDIHLDVKGAPTIEGDAKKLGIAVEELLSNAVKFTPQGGIIQVRARKEHGQAVIEVQDSGLGLTPEAQASLFQPLRQTHGRMITESGAGLGLYISQGIARLHGGRLVAESEGPGKGSTFRLFIPAP